MELDGRLKMVAICIVSNRTVVLESGIWAPVSKVNNTKETHKDMDGGRERKQFIIHGIENVVNLVSVIENLNLITKMKGNIPSPSIHSPRVPLNFYMFTKLTASSPTFYNVFKTNLLLHPIKI